jgi:glycosyltransferase involved in cell wall biosynthesis
MVYRINYNMKLSVIIPSWKDPLLKKTIESLLTTSELGDQLEVIAVLDGYWISGGDIVDDPRVRYVHVGKNRGMRDAINAGVSIARGEFIMRSDEHCMFAPGFDLDMINVCKSNWIMTARRFFLDPVKWKVMDEPYVDYEKLVIQENKKFAGQRWRSRDKNRRDIQIDETMAMQGSCWLMPRQWWLDVIGELQTEGYGPLYQDSHEMVFKTWQAGGHLMLNKNTWFAHKHRSFARTHNNGTKENKHTEANWLYSLETWRDYYEKEVRPKWKI